MAADKAPQEQFLKQLTLAAAESPSLQGPILSDTITAPYLGPPYAPAPVRVQDLMVLRREGALPEIQPSEEARLQAAAELQISMSAQPRLSSDDRSAMVVAGVQDPTEDGCVSIGPGPTLQRPTAVIGVSEPASIGIRSENRGGIEVLIRRDGIVSPLPRALRLAAGSPAFLNLGVPGSEAILRLPSGQTMLCNLRLP